MKLGLYIKSKLGIYSIPFTALLISAGILYAFGVMPEAIVVVAVIMLLGYGVSELVDFLRRKRFYNRLLMNLEELDRKYLIAEMIGEPDFYEAEILSEALREACKSMGDTVGSYRRETSDFREYIELWVHEVKLPVASLRLMCHNDGSTKYLKQIGRIENYIDNVLYYTRSNSAEKDYRIQEVLLKRAFTEVAVRYREELQGNNISLRTENLNVSVMSDGKWLAFMLSQLMANSIKYAASDRESEIFVRAEEMADRTVLYFRDNGIGIPEADLPRIFDKTFTGENGRIGAKSTGMGLYLVRKLCKKLGHEVSADSRQGEYTEIRISFGKNTFNEVL